MTDLERLLTASNTIERQKKELKLSAEAIAALKETLLSRDNELALLKAQLALIEAQFQKMGRNGMRINVTRWPISDLNAKVNQ